MKAAVGDTIGFMPTYPNHNAQTIAKILPVDVAAPKGAMNQEMKLNVSKPGSADAVLNISANCVDRHLASPADQTAILWEPDSPNDAPRAISYFQQ